MSDNWELIKFCLILNQEAMAKGFKLEVEDNSIRINHSTLSFTNKVENEEQLYRLTADIINWKS
ncbi:hypothetical protein [Halobacillus sp. H74]|uniref:hypothetical protein n=1 Tax=Halobacillus sp. H74 TaxID=3457436 RepID=UPI003FCC5CE5